MALSPETLGAAIAIFESKSDAGIISSRVDAIEAKIPTAASSSNKLADKAFVNDSINNSSAFYRGSYATKAALLAVNWQTQDESAAYYVSNNDYAYVEADETHNDQVWRYCYKYEAGGLNNGWQAQYMINEGPFTQEQWDAINSGIDAEKVAEIGRVFTGAGALTEGAKGVVPAPDVQGKYLSSDGTWKAVDSTPTSNSANLATSGGIKTALDLKADKTDVMGAYMDNEGYLCFEDVGYADEHGY